MSASNIQRRRHGQTVAVRCVLWFVLFGLHLDKLAQFISYFQSYQYFAESKGIATKASYSSNTGDNRDGDIAPKANQTHWCVISRQTSSLTASKYPKHFPHAAENILPCWSWFVRQNTTKNCGFVFIVERNFRHFISPVQTIETIPVSWQEQLVRRMGCQVREVEMKQKTSIGYPLGDGPDAPIQHTVPLQLKLPRHGRITYLERQEDAVALRRLFFSDDWIAQHKGGLNPLQIGVLQRKTSRSMTNLDDLVRSLRDALPDAHVTVTTMDSPWLEEQAAWFATKDVIISPHGAALTNAIFCTPGTIVMQLYSKNYFWQSLEPLIEATGAVALDWYEGYTPHMDFELAGYKGRNSGREANITAPVEDIVDPILYALGRKPHSVEDLIPSRHKSGKRP